MPTISGKDAERFEKSRLEAEERAKNPTPEMIAERKRLQDFYNAIMKKSKINDA
jgi:hypothetical protein